MRRRLLALLVACFPAPGASDSVPLETLWQRSRGGAALEAASVPGCFDFDGRKQTWKRTLSVPPGWRNRHLRLDLLVAATASEVWLDGFKVGKEGRTYDLSPILQAGIASELQVHLTCVPDAPCGLIEATLLSTPRVFLSGENYTVDGAGLELVTELRNTLDNTANIDLHWELSFRGRTVATAAMVATVPPSMTQDIAVRLQPTAAFRRWGIHDPHLYTLRTIMVKHAEAVEGDYDMERNAILPIREIQRGQDGWLVNGERVHPTHLKIPANCYPGRNTVPTMLDTPAELLNTRGLPVASWVQSTADRLGRLVSPDPGEPGNSKARVRILASYVDSGDTVVEIENPAGEGNYTLRSIQITAGHVSQVVAELRPGERRKLRFEHVNPYRVEVKTGSGVVLASH